MEIVEILKTNRSYRRFVESVRIPQHEVEQWIKNLRYTSSMRNTQPLKYCVITLPELCEKIYPHLAWAGFLKDWNGPDKGERPTAFVVQLLDENLSQTSRFDEGLQLEALTLQAVEAGYGCCIIAAFSAKAITEALGFATHLKPIAIVAIGKPSEKVVIEELLPNEPVAYYRSPDGVHHVPKRRGEDLLIAPKP